jgi:acyl transferase domain-containing protein/NADPH:quinone reductase-like Zn-dependent oxidoreductase/SAM-dependent methyltransferase/acyl carrier protein/short-subunit dehydrogenase
MSKDPIAIIGIGCRFPGAVNDVESFWKLLVDAREAVTDVPPDRWNIEHFFDLEPGLPGKSIAKRAGFLEHIDQFDPQFFGISPREAPYVDPQHRLLLETAWEAIEDAGVILDFERGTDIGVFVGISHNEYQGIQGTAFDHSGIGPHSPTGCAHSIAANRISYCLNLQGPSVAMDTACSSALTAVHMACEHIRAGRGDTALAGGVTVIITPGGFIGFSQASMLSPEGQCKAFDAAANGFVRGEGAGMLLLKRLSRALADGDPIQGVIIGTALNQDGHTNGISLPSAEAQAKLVIEACANAGVSPAHIGFVEAHGTGTAVGDPIEAHALSQALCRDRAPEHPLPIGSVKTNLGHLETAAGLAGLIKAMLVLKHRRIPASLHFNTPNPNIDFAALKLRIPTTLEPFPETTGPRMAGVNSFGFGGANAHVLLVEPPATPHAEHEKIREERSWPIMLSARSEESLRSNAMRVAAWVDERSLANGLSPVLPDLVYTLGARRNHHAHRLSLVANSLTELVQELTNYATGQPGPKIQTTFAPRPAQSPRVAFVMSGQGPQWWGMGRELMRHEPVFRGMIDRCDAAMRPYSRFSLLEELSRSEEETQMSRTEVAQPAIFAFQVALAELWKSWGIQPAAVVGHSVGEVAAACIAGVLTLEEAARVIVLRARLMEECARGEGTMLAVGLDEECALDRISRHDRTITIAAFNGPNSLTLAGPRLSLETIAAELEAEEIFARFVRVDHPFHHPLMRPASELLETELADLTPQPETIPFYSTVTGQKCAGVDCVAEHWGRGIRQPVQFASAVDALAESGIDVWLEISSQPALVRSIQDSLAERNGKPTVFSSVRRDREHESLLETSMDLHRANVPIDFTKMTPSRRLLPLPAYAWDRSRWWHEANEWAEGRLNSSCGGFLDVKLPRAIPTWQARLDNRHLAFLKDHKVDNLVVFPAAAFVEMALEAGTQLFNGHPFTIEDFEIRKPLILPDRLSELHLEVSYDPNERTFSIQSQMHHGANWSLHVAGTMRGERTEASFGSSTFEGSADLTPLVVEDFYGYMSDLGLPYGEEFRPIRQLAVGQGRSEGQVELSEKTSPRASEYSLHPVLFDGSLHIFSAAAAAMEDRKAGLKLPVRFSKILFLHSPGDTSRVRATVHHCSSEYVEGRIELFDEDGRPCVLVDGFRAIAIAGAHRGAAQAMNRNVLYHLAWERTPAELNGSYPEPVPLSRLHGAAQEALNEVIAVRGQSAIEQAMIAGDQLAAATLAAGVREMASAAGAKELSSDSLRVIEPMQHVFNRFMTSLAKRGWIEANGSGYYPTPAFYQAADSASDVLRKFVADHPGYLAEAMLCTANCAELGAILRGEKDAVQVLFAGNSAELLDHFYCEGLYTSHWLAAITAAIQETVRHLPEGRPLRILEVGAGTGGLSAHLLPLIEHQLHAYTFTDVSAAFFGHARQKLANFTNVEYKIFDLEKPAAEQGFQPAEFDFIVGTNVLHAAGDLRVALKQLLTLLAPGGNLAFMDVANPQLWTEVVFGLTTGWWRFTDRDLRSSHPLLPRSQWESVLLETGFAEAATLAGLVGPEGEGQFGFLARKAWRKPDASSATSNHNGAGVTDRKETLGAAEGGNNGAGVKASPETAPTAKSWMVFSDDSSLSQQLVSQLHKLGVRCRTVRIGDGFAKTGSDAFTITPKEFADWKSLLERCAEDAPPERIVYFCKDGISGLGEQAAALMETDALLHLVQAIDAVIGPTSKIRLDLVTRGAQPVGRTKRPTALAQAPALGLFRVILNEYPSFSGRGIDLGMGESASDFSFLWDELMRVDGEREVAFRGQARYVQRIVRGRSSHQEPLDSSVPLRLESRERGHLDRLGFKPFILPDCGPGQVLIEVKAAGLNFRDVLKALALYPSEAPDARLFGDEVAGIVKAVGADVDHVKPGDRVFGLAVFGLATHTLARGGDIRRIPRGLSFEEAATLPVVFMTSWHALHNVARMRPGESILVHAGAGGVGMAAIQIAHQLGAEVIATAGSPVKRMLLEKLGVKHVIDSRRGDFADAVMQLTNRRGVDVVLNALAAEAIPMGLSCLAEFGRFIEIGKRDIYQNSRIPLWPLRRNASFHVVAMDAVFSGDESLTRRMLAEISDLVESGSLQPLPFRSFPAARVDAAFRLMAQGKHIGKVLMAFPEVFRPKLGEPLAAGFQVDPEGCYLITGGFGGFGKVIAQWLADAGARDLALVSRRGADTPEAQAFLASLRQRGVSVSVLRGDVGSANDVNHIVEEIRSANRPLKGVFHLAMVIDDAPLSALTRDRMGTVLAPKANGAWLLHEATQDLKLDCFVMFSSVSSVFGNPAQGNYAAANAFLDSLAHHRRALGLPGLTINWGALGGEGYVARNERVAEFLARQGTGELSPREVVELMESSLAADSTQVIAIRVDWAKWRQVFRSMQERPLLERIFATIEGQETPGVVSDYRQRIEAAAPEEVEGIVGQAVRDAVASVLRVKPETLRDDQPLTDLGLDSLMGVEIENTLDASLGVALPPASLTRARTIGQIVSLIAEYMGAKQTGTAPAKKAAVRETPNGTSAEEVDLTALSDEEIASLLGEDSSAESSDPRDVVH